MSQTTTRIVLTRGRELIADESLWLQGKWSRDSATGTQRCAYQAVKDASTMLGLPAEPALASLAAIVAEMEAAEPEEAIPQFNDNAEHEDVMAMFDLALETA